ncbi:GntR family transcriptional regulator [Solicola sp. PLA-1-18]|uniref:GntR family transcriptional regulator n=1 Tax=Solicola sp. PLA-1-18 TaxID=3380532 RepID=UPI003B7C5B58
MSGLVGIDLASPTPPFEQLRTQVAAQVRDGVLEAGQKLPTVRQLAADLGLAANTVARAYRELESDGVVVTHGRRGTFVADGVRAPGTEAEARAAAESLVFTARRLGLSLAETSGLVERAWGR